MNDRIKPSEESPSPANLTKAQAEALSKWRDGKAKNEVALKVRMDVYERLRRNGMLRSVGHLHRVITDEGLSALSAYDAKHGRVAQ